MVTRLPLLLLLLLCVPGCSMLPGARAPRRLRLPSDMRPAPAASTATEAKKDAKPQPHAPRYVVRLAERGRVWELELPDGAGGYEVRVPLDDGPLQATPADTQLLAGERPLPPPGTPQVDAVAAAQERSYLGHLARVSEMFTARRYELALIEVVDLERLYPKDARLQAMKGSLYSKLRKPALAREAWQRALSLDPDDAVVAAALRELDEQRE
jgi:tetratricopeptide (TPR) repeat protein